MAFSHARDGPSIWNYLVGGGDFGARPAAYRPDDEGRAGIEDCRAAPSLGLGRTGDTSGDGILPVCFRSDTLLREQSFPHKNGNATPGGPECIDFPSDGLPARGTLGRLACNSARR